MVIDENGLFFCDMSFEIKHNEPLFIMRLRKLSVSL